MAGKAKLRIHIKETVAKIGAKRIWPNQENTNILTDPFKATSNKDSIGTKEESKYILEIQAIASM